eukprot:UC4_evm1s1332
MCARKCVEILDSVSFPLALDDRDKLLKCARTSLNSKVISQYSDIMAPIVVDAVLKVAQSDSVDLRDIRVTKSIGGTLEDTELVNGVFLPNKVSHIAGGIGRIENAKVGLIQFCISPPKTDMENSVVISDYTQMDRVLREERKYILEIVKKIAKSGCNVLLIQKSILRDAVNDLALHYLSKKKILVVRDIEREDIGFIYKSLGCKPMATVDQVSADKLASVDLVEEAPGGVRLSGVQHESKTASIVIKASNKLVLEEADRSIHDALCVIRCLVKKKALIAGGGAPEIECGLQLLKYSQSLVGMESYCARAFADALEVVPFTLAENAGLNPISTVTELRARHQAGETTAGINVRK